MPKFRSHDTYADMMESQCECVQKPIPIYQQTPFASISHIHQETSRLFLLLLACTLDLCRTPESLLSVLALLAYIPSNQYDFQTQISCSPQAKDPHTLLSAGLLDLCGSPNANQSVVGLELLQCFR